MTKNIVAIIYLILLILALLIPISICFIGYQNPQEIEIIVKDKFIKNNNKSGIYLIVDSNNETYQITDLIFKGKFNSTDLYNQLEIGKKYKIETTGYRIHILSKYQNINKIYELEEK